MKMKLLILTSFVCVYCSAPVDNKGNGSGQHIRQLIWILGEWQNQTEAGVYVETWKQLNDTTFIGKAYILNSSDTVFSENVSLLKMERS